jgi:hypothetical protein
MTVAGTTGRSATAKYPPFSEPGRRDGLPPIEQFVDEMPSILEFLEDETQAAVGMHSDAEFAEVQPDDSEIDGEGWASAEWQAYDWSSLASLGARSDRVAADRSWGSTEWDSRGTVAVSQSDGPSRAASGSSVIAPTAHEVAQALDGIARRIRLGEVVIDASHGMSPEAAMAAALAILLRMRG